ncbi:MAG: GNAT family N-acetyltransferase [Armatimonadetes bacterium]|nr:GNAT family N-acetyltransferase [Armatimonadota bacterium]
MLDNVDPELPPLPRGQQIRFYRADLSDLPELEVPPGYSFRCYRPGDEADWAEVLTASFPGDTWTVEKIEKEFTKTEKFRPERICIAEHEGKIAGVAAAWEQGEPEWGYVHWVGVHPEHQGKRLGRLLTLGTLHRFRVEGKRKVYLDTDEPRIPAIATYLSLGFQPDLRLATHREMWERVQAVMAERRRSH